MAETRVSRGGTGLPTAALRKVAARRGGFDRARRGYVEPVIEILRTADGTEDPLFIRCNESDAAGAIARCVDLAVRLGHTLVVVDLGEDVDPDADVLSVLHRRARLMQEAGGRLEVICRTPQVRRLLDMTLLSRTISVREPSAHDGGRHRDTKAMATLERGI